MSGNNVATFVANRAKEPTTWAGIVSMALGAFVSFSTGDMAGLGAGVAGILGGLVSIFSKERK